MTDTTAPRTDVVAQSRNARLALTPRQARFVEAYARPGLKHGEPCLNAAEAARVAGYGHKRADNTAFKLLRNPKVRAAVDALRAEVAERAGYTAEKAMGELDDVITHALKTENASAHGKAVELRMRLAGLLIERVDTRIVGGFAVNVIGLAPREAAHG
jgi:hypothetical protein